MRVMLSECRNACHLDGLTAFMDVLKQSHAPFSWAARVSHQSGLQDYLISCFFVLLLTPTSSPLLPVHHCPFGGGRVSAMLGSP